MVDWLTSEGRMSESGYGIVFVSSVAARFIPFDSTPLARLTAVSRCCFFCGSVSYVEKNSFGGFLASQSSSIALKLANRLSCFVSCKIQVRLRF